MAEAKDATSPAPRENPNLVGHEAAERMLAGAVAGDRLAHAWLIAGARGIGKATLAFRFARYVLSGAGASGDAGLFGPAPTPESLYVDPEDPVFRRIAVRAHADLVTLECTVDPKTKRLRAEIPIDSVRDMGRFLRLTPAEGGYRVVVIDAAENLNRNAANALLKLLEEPPDRALIILVSHAPGQLTATIRSRCRLLDLQPLPDETVVDLIAGARPDLDAGTLAAITHLSEGSPGRAYDLVEQGGFDLYREMLGLLDTIPSLDIVALHGLGDRLARRGAERTFATAFDLLAGWLARAVTATARTEPITEIVAGEAAIATKLLAARGLDRWVELWENIGHLAGRTERLNLDRKQAVISAFSAIERAARG